MSTYRDEDGGYRSHTDPYTSFDFEHQAHAHEQQRLAPSPYLGYTANESTDSDTYSSLKDDVYVSNSGLGEKYMPVKGDTKTDIWIKPFIMLWAYWFLAFPAINAAWLLRTSGSAFSGIGSVFYYPWTVLVKAIGAPYYLAFYFDGIGQLIAMPIIAVIWFCILTYVCNLLWDSKPWLMKGVLTVLAIAAAIPVALAVIAFMSGALRGEIVQSFWYGHDPYTSLVWDFLHHNTFIPLPTGVEL